ncbi:MAG: glycosyltransferase family 39 protein [Ignavibacteria bacterium]|nr:glycosyltransferase family 39 protein [Ignavibacteria bacterium]
MSDWKPNKNSVLDIFRYHRIKNFILKGFYNDIISILFLLLLKFLFQYSILANGYRWLSADDFCRAVISFNWINDPKIYSGVWLSFHFWFTGFMILFIKDIITAATTLNFIFSAITLIYFYKIILITTDRKTAFWSAIIFSIFPFQVWLSLSGLPESAMFFFVTAGAYYLIKWRQVNKNYYLLLSAVFLMLSNGFRYEGWFFSMTLVLMVIYYGFKEKKTYKDILSNTLIASVSFISIFWWLLQNYLDFNDPLFFLKETARIYEDYRNVGIMQRLIQYPAFIFYIAPLTAIFSLKILYKTFRSVETDFKKIFIIYNLAEIGLLIFQGLAGTGGTNMISRYVVINCILLIPVSVEQYFRFRKYIAIFLIAVTSLIYIIWSYNFPQPFRDDTFEVGYMLRHMFEKENGKDSSKVYFEEVTGFYDVFAVQALSNDPSRFVLGHLPDLTQVSKKIKSKEKISGEELNILDILSFMEKNYINTAVVKSETYREKLKKISLRDEEIGDYKIFYFQDRESNVNDSTLEVFAKNVISLKENPDLLNFERMLTVDEIKIDNSNFGINPQTVTVDWRAVNEGLIDSLEYDEFEFDRYQAVLELRIPENDSVIHSEFKRIFSDRNIEDLIEINRIRTIIIIKPFALLQYSLKKLTVPFESGAYNLVLKLRDNKYEKDMILYRGDSLYKISSPVRQDTLVKGIDTTKIKQEIPKSKKDTLINYFNIGSILAMFPNADIPQMMLKGNVNIQKMLLANGLRILFSQRHQGDYFLNFIFSSF